MRFMTEEEIIARDEKLRKIRRREAFFESIMSCVRPIVFTPLSIMFHLISFVARGIGCVSSFGLVLGFYRLYQSFVAFKNGVPLGEIDTIGKALPLIFVPFIAYAVSEITGRIYEYFEMKAI